jgi:SOS-response transcriptional repressor LexA
MPIGINVSSMNMPKGIKPELRPLIARRIRDLLARPGMTQEVLAQHCGVDQTIVSRWGSGARTPGIGSFQAIAHLVPEDEKEWWFELAGVPKVLRPDDPAFQSRPVPLFKGRVAAGHGREIEGEIEKELPLPKEWFQPGSKIIAMKVEGDSMSPLINDGYYVLIDIAERDIKRLAGHMVAARSQHGCTVKWLRKWGKFYQLMPQHVSEEHPAPIIDPENHEDFAIIGRVVKWVGEPKPPKRQVKR